MGNLQIRTALWCVLALVAITASWIYMHRVLLPWEYYVNVEHGHLKAQMGDLYPRWVGTRELLLNGRNPYSKEVSAEIQIAFYGHAIEQRYDSPKSEILDEQRFVYPIYIVLALAPTVHADFQQLQAWAPIVLGALTATSVLLWLSVLRWRPPPLATVALILLVLSTPQIAQGLRLRQFGLLVAFLLALATWLVSRGHYFLAGIVLACSTIKPQMIALCLLWFMVWTVGDWKARWRLAAAFGITMTVLAGVGEILLPGWPSYFFAGLVAYQKYFPTSSPLRLIFGNWVGGALSVLGVAALLAVSWHRRKAAANSTEFLQALSLFFIASTLVLPLLTPYNQVLLLLPVLMLVRDWNTIARAGRLLFAGILLWPVLIFIAFLVHPPRVNTLSNLPLLPSALELLLPFLTLWLILVHRPRTAEPSTHDLVSARFDMMKRR